MICPEFETIHKRKISSDLFTNSSCFSPCVFKSIFVALYVSYFKGVCEKDNPTLARCCALDIRWIYLLFLYQQRSGIAALSYELIPSSICFAIEDAAEIVFVDIFMTTCRRGKK
jgi:hypothetical protein